MWDKPLSDSALLGAQAPKNMRWFYQLQNVDPYAVGHINADIKVVDYTRDGRAPWTKEEVARMRTKGGKVIAYFSIGEAENYRAYWKPEWQPGKPYFLDVENPDWKGNYKVRFWRAEWQSILKDTLDQIIDQGFDGVYLDIIDAYEYYDRPDAMVVLVKWIAAYSRLKRKDFWVVPQNGEGLLIYPSYVAAINAIAKEDLYYGIHGDERPNSIEETFWSKEQLRVMKEAHKPVLVVEYLTDAKKVQRAISDLRVDGFVPYITTRPLDKPTEPV